MDHTGYEFHVATRRTVSGQQVLDSLCNWYDSGLSNFWIDHIDRRPYRFLKNVPDVMKDTAFQLPVKVKTAEDCEVNGQRWFTLDVATLQRGLDVMAAKYPKAFVAEFPADPDDYNGDATTSDLFVQCALFGEEVFA